MGSPSISREEMHDISLEKLDKVKVSSQFYIFICVVLFSCLHVSDVQSHNYRVELDRVYMRTLLPCTER